MTDTNTPPAAGERMTAEYEVAIVEGLIALVDKQAGELADLKARHVFTEQLAEAMKTQVAKAMSLERELGATLGVLDAAKRDNLRLGEAIVAPPGRAVGEEEECDRADIVIDRAVNCGWITVHNREQLHANIRLALDTEVRAHGPYLDKSAAVEKPGKYPRIEARPFNDPPTPSKDADK